MFKSAHRVLNSSTQPRHLNSTGTPSTIFTAMEVSENQSVMLDDCTNIKSYDARAYLHVLLSQIERDQGVNLFMKGYFKHPPSDNGFWSIAKIRQHIEWVQATGDALYTLGFHFREDLRHGNVGRNNPRLKAFARLSKKGCKSIVRLTEDIFAKIKILVNDPRFTAAFGATEWSALADRASVSVNDAFCSIQYAIRHIVTEDRTLNSSPMLAGSLRSLRWWDEEPPWRSLLSHPGVPSWEEDFGLAAATDQGSFEAFMRGRDLREDGSKVGETIETNRDFEPESMDVRNHAECQVVLRRSSIINQAYSRLREGSS
ncbi:hypothetical protein BKA63DRAFT_497446 [Paraphoma chrysanthemicola]|nr:hypothetical protein BKA63DRAFT_497446 [Paraphoma chrysanthemicola]